MRTLFIFVFLLSINAIPAQQVINNKGNRLQTYPKVEQINPEIKSLIDQVSIQNLESYIRWMQDLNRRPAEMPEALITQNWLVDNFESFGLDVYTHHFPLHEDTLDAGNVIAIQYGAEFPEEYIIVSSHYDHQSGPGADDNASGTAGVLEIARILSRHSFKRTIMYIPFNAEEYGLIGSNAYAKKCAEEDMNILGCFNLDMLGFFPEDEGPLTMYSGSSFISDRLWDYYQTVANLYLPDIPTKRFTFGDTAGGDHMPFNMYEYPALYIGDIEYKYKHPCYHRPCDTLGNGVNNLGLAQAFTQATLASVCELADGWLPPQNLSVIPFGEHIKISWDTAPETGKYKLYKNGSFLLEINDTSYTDTDVITGENYNYYVTGIHHSTGKESAKSNTDSIKLMPSLVLPYSNGFEENMNEWRTFPSWVRVREDTHSGEYCIYNNGENASENYLSIAELQWFSIPDTATNVTLSFYLKGSILYDGWEVLNTYVEITTDRKEWRKLLRTRSRLHWHYLEFSLNEYIGEPFVQIRFRIEFFGQSGPGRDKNIFIDDIAVSFNPLHDFPVPTNVRAEYDHVHRAAIIEWDKMTSARGYNVYKNGVKINAEVIMEPEYKDNTGLAYYCYQVTALYEEESALSPKACLSTVGVEPIRLHEIKIAPNPSRGIINISTSLNHPYAIAVYNIQGLKVLQRDNFTDGTLDISNLPAGVYILKINTAKEGISKKIIIN